MYTDFLIPSEEDLDEEGARYLENLLEGNFTIDGGVLVVDQEQELPSTIKEKIKQVLQRFYNKNGR